MRRFLWCLMLAHPHFPRAAALSALHHLSKVKNMHFWIIFPRPFRDLLRPDGVVWWRPYHFALYRSAADGVRCRFLLHLLFLAGGPLMQSTVNRRSRRVGRMLYTKQVTLRPRARMGRSLAGRHFGAFAARRCAICTPKSKNRVFGRVCVGVRVLCCWFLLLCLF